MDPRARWQALQAHLSAARFAIKMGDREKAREEVETALAIDPDFLAARMLRDQLNAPEPFAPLSQPPPPPVASLAASAARLAALEERVKQRVRDRQGAPSDEARQPVTASRQYSLGALAVAAAVFTFAISSSSVRESRVLYSRGTAAGIPLVDPLAPGRIDPIVEVAVPAAPETRAVPAAAAEVPLPPRLILRPAPLRVSVVTAPVAPVTPVLTPPPLTVSTAPATAVVTDSPPPAIAPRVIDDRALVEETLSRYRRAYNRLDARSAQAVYPAVNAPALARAFDGLQSQSLEFDECNIDVNGGSATVTCRGTSRYVPKIGSRDPHVEPRVWAFRLRKDEGDWKIENARASR